MFGLFRTSDDNNTQQEPARVYTRSRHAEPADPETLTRFSNRPQMQRDRQPVATPAPRPQPAPTPAPATAQRSPAPKQRAPQAKPRINENAHLHASNQIPLWVFKKALPQRFADMSQNNDEFVFQ